MKDVRSTIPKSNYTVGRSHKIDQLTFHHIVGDAPAALARFRTPGVEVSSTYVIGSNGTVYYVVDEKNTPYTNGDTPSTNPRSITIEHAGGGNLPYTEAMYEASIKLVKSIRTRHKITRFKRHRDLTATLCPGNLDVERILRESKPGDKMVTTEQLNIIYRFLLGRPVSEYGLKNYRGKVTFDEAYDAVKASKSYKALVATGEKNPENHLPKELRS